LKPSSTVICLAILNKNFCTVEPNNNKTTEISAPVINTPLEDEKVTVEQSDKSDKTLEKFVPPLKDEKVTDEILEKLFMEGSRELSKKRGKRDNDFIDWNNSMHLIKRSEEVLPDKKPTPEELESIRATKPVASLASLVNESPTLQKLIDLGVGLWSWEKQGQLGLAVKLDFQEDVVPLIQFLSDLGVPSDHLGKTLTRCPALLEQSLQDLTARVSYLQSKKLTSEDILTIVGRMPKWLTFSVKGIDGRLGFLQKTFQLSGNEVRILAVDSPDLVLKRDLVEHVQTITFSLNEEMGFSADEIKCMLLTNARIFLVGREALNITFDVLHNEAGIPHELLSKFPEALSRNSFRIKHRHQFLLKLKRAQYDPALPNYVSPAMLAELTPAEFCQQVAQCDTELYFKFLRTL